MTALNVSYTDPNGLFASRYGDVTAALSQAFDAWMRHFDTPRGAVTINVSVGFLPTGFAASASPSGVVAVGGTASRPVNMSGFGAEIAGGAALSANTRSAQLTLDAFWLSTYFARPAANTVEIQRVLQHEIGHMLGVIGYTTVGAAGPRPLPSYTTEFDTYLSFGGGRESFVGPNAVASYGGPVNMDTVSVDHPYVPGQVSLMSYQDEATTVQPLDLAMLRDTGLPILSNQEVAEHEAIRLYQAGLGRTPDTAGLMAASRALLGGAALGMVANGFVTSAEFTQRFGANLSDAAFVDALYQNVLHRAGDAGGVQAWTGALAGGMSRADALAGFSESPESRLALAADPNLSYSGTAEAQAERLYDTAFGRAPDPLGFANLNHALLNGLTLQQAALGFLGSPEFASRYGAAASNGALVDALYQNTLHRAADAPGRAHWLDALNGGLGRADLVVAFSESAEHVANVARHDTALSGSLLADPSAHLGSIPVLPQTLVG